MITDVTLRHGELVLEFEFEDENGEVHTALNIGDKFVLKESATDEEIAQSRSVVKEQSLAESEIYVSDGVARDDEGNVFNTKVPDGVYNVKQFYALKRRYDGGGRSSGSSYRRYGRRY